MSAPNKKVHVGYVDGRLYVSTRPDGRGVKIPLDDVGPGRAWGLLVMFERSGFSHESLDAIRLVLERHAAPATRAMFVAIRRGIIRAANTTRSRP
jgi:hypothetical protein